MIIVMTDDQGLGDFSFTGNPVLKTPNFDAFAEEAVRFTDFHVCPMCSPTHGQLLTGLTALRNGATSVTAGRTFLRPGIPTLADMFGEAGYKTGIFGKWHLGDNSGYVREAVGGPNGGYWHIQVEESGEYEFTLRRWPKQTEVALGEKYEPSANSPANKANLTTVGFPTIAAATIDIAGMKASSTADPEATGATLTATLSAGRTKLKAWFADAEGNGLCGAFFVTVARKK